MIELKTLEEIKILRQGGKILAGVLDELVKLSKPGANTEDLENLALKLISVAGGRPSFKDYSMGGNIFFPSALCVSINKEVVHGASLPNRILKSGDIVGLDIGMEWPIQSKEEAEKNNIPFNHRSEGGGFYTDMCRTVAIGKISKEARRLINVSREALMLGISQAKAGNTINDIGRAVETFVQKNGFSVVRDLVGHGVGYMAHEAPNVFNYVINEKDSENIELKSGMVIAIEPMINVGRFNVKVANNNYTFISSDGSLSSHYEHSIAITDSGNIILTEN
ncbi:type I methionyl aminopeptidase [Candidatus Falkowbacteria bacterium HGW-Falkowbacteria-1]|jgi:methionyl aminopeptidase|uniref:Methionine aminopeptidase n=1 Tax=Candidatus Falkowbacteria bacterium HGW-Falkowbacteria-1 TaxID=2013768 RepID=A0A2N2E9D0_9BACT|nr:MAG: type I methionyl aminopeptidase [Candidatus Falkowbacteria bacterium HGW-Falkowbacteria-1]